MNQAVLDRGSRVPGDTSEGGVAAPVAARTAMRRRWRTWLWALLAPVAVVALIAAIVLSQMGGGGLRPGEAELNANGGRAQVQPAGGGPAEQVTGSTRVRTGDIVTAEFGQPSLALAGGGTLRLRAAAGAVEAASVKVATTPELRNGDLLATSTASAYKLEADGTIITVGARSTVRFERVNATLDVGVYQGSASIASAGVDRTVGALRQVTVAGLRNVDEAYAISIDTSDAWDRQYLAPAIDAQHLIEPLSTSFDGVAGAATLTAAQLHRALPGLLTEEQLRTRLVQLPASLDPGGVLVGATIASLGTRGTAAQRWEHVFSFHVDGGASWGLVAMDQGVTPGALSAALQAAVQRLLETSSPTPTLVGSSAPAATVPASGVAGGPSPDTASPPGSQTPSTAPSSTEAPRTPGVSVPSSPSTTTPQPLLTLPAPLPQLTRQITGPLTGGLTGGGGGDGGTGQGGTGPLDPLLRTVGGLLNGLDSLL